MAVGDDAEAAIIRRLEALERATEKRLDDARDIHRREHEAAEKAHSELHAELERNVLQRFDAHAELHSAHESSHAREHAMTTAYASQRDAMFEQRWATEKEARDLARQAIDKRLEQMNEFRAQLTAQAATFVTNAAHDAVISGLVKRIEEMQSGTAQRFADTTKHTDDRYEDNRKRIEALEKGTVKEEGKSLGQGAIVAIIVGAVGVAGTVLGIIVVLANFATGGTP